MNARSTFLILAGILCFLGLVLAAEVGYFLSTASTAEGKVVSVGKRSSGSGWRYTADVTFSDSRNVAHTVHYSYITTPLVSLLSTGRPIGVLYSADEPESSARLDFFPILWFWPGVFILATIGTAILAWKASQKLAPAPPPRRPAPTRREL